MRKIDARLLSASLLFVAAVFLGYSVLHAQPAPAAQASKSPKLAEEEFKNIKALKGVPADQLIPTMQFITASLGVDCEYCHVRGSFEKDEKKPKLAARKMIEMVLAINKDNFKGHLGVSCYSCHRGAKEPVGIPLVGEQAAANEDEAPQPATPPALPQAQEILDKYLAAVGGKGAVDKIESRVEKGTLAASNGMQSSIEVYTKAPYKRISIMHMKNGESITGYDGEKGWLQFPGRVHWMSVAENESARMDADLHFAADVSQQFDKFRVRPGEPVDGKETVLVIGRSEGKTPVKLYFDTQSGLLLRLVRYVESPVGLNPTQIDYGDYRESDGVKVPYRWGISRPGSAFTIQVEQLQQNVAIDDGRFAAPPPEHH